MQKAKAALVEAGIIKSAGRGRISADGHAWLKARYDEGVRFSDWPKGQVTVSKSEEKTVVRVQRDSSQSNEKTVAELAPYRFTEDEFKVVETDSKKVRSLREACNNCRVSLVVCYCESPRIVAVDGRGSVAVRIVRK